MTPKEELIQFIESHKDDNRVLLGLFDMASRVMAGESMESIAASYGVKCDSTNQVAQEARDDHSK